MTAFTFDQSRYQAGTIVPGHPDVLFTQARTLRHAAQDVRTHAEVVRRNVPQSWRGTAAAAFGVAHANELRRLEDWAARTDAVADVLERFALVHGELQEQARQLTIRLYNLDTRLDNAGRIVNNARGDIAADCSMEVIRARNDLDEARTQRVGVQISCESLTAEFHMYAQRAAALIDDIIGHARDPLPDFDGDARRAAFASQFAEGYFGGGRALTPADFGFTEAALPSLYAWLRGEREGWGPDVDTFWALYDDSAIHVGDHRDRAHNHWDNYVDIIAAIAASLGPACARREFVSQQTAAWHQGDDVANLIAAGVLVGLANPFGGLEGGTVSEWSPKPQPESNGAPRTPNLEQHIVAPGVGDIVERVYESPAGRVHYGGEVISTDNGTLHLDNFSIYGERNGHVSPDAYVRLDEKGLYTLRAEGLAWARRLGYEQVTITGIRVTGAGAGRPFNWTLKTGR